MDSGLIVNALLLGVGLAMDAFSVSMANGLKYSDMKKSKIIVMAGSFAFLQAAMPLIGWFIVQKAEESFSVLEEIVPWIAMGLLVFIGIKMLMDGIKEEEDNKIVTLTAGAILLQGLATSIDALSVGFTIDSYGFPEALFTAGIIAAITFIICVIGVNIGKKAGTKLAGKATILGGIILIAIGIEILVKSFL